MIGYQVMINVKERWIDTGEYDEYGIEIKKVNPNPIVIIHRGIWCQKEGQLVRKVMRADEFRRFTGHIVYGGSLEPRGPHYIRLNERGRDGLIKAFGIEDRVKEVSQVPRVKCIIRRKTR